MEWDVRSGHEWLDELDDLKDQEEYDDAQRLAFGLWFPYNQALTDIKNVLLAPTWLGIRYYLEKKGVLL